MNKISTKTIDYDIKYQEVRGEVNFSGYASIFHIIDNHNDIIMPGAFAKTLLKKRKVKLLWQHKSDEPIGYITLLKEDAKGLYVEGKILLELRKGREAYSLLKAGAINGLSIGYRVVKSNLDRVKNARIINEIELFEISVVTFPANENSQITDVKFGDLGNFVVAIERAKKAILPQLQSSWSD